jgi:isopenicillin N synthase-like dioxygenase
MLNLPKVQVLGNEWRKTVLDFEEKVHEVAVTILKAIFVGLGRDEAIIDEVRMIVELACDMSLNLVTQECGLPDNL